MTFTPFGLVFAALGFTLLVWRRAWLLPLLVVSAGLHAFAIVVVGSAKASVGFGVSPWLFTSGLIFIHLVGKMTRQRQILFGASREVRLLFFGWLAYSAWCVLSAFTLPFIFEGLPVYLLAHWIGFVAPQVPLYWTKVNAVQAINTMIIAMILVYVLQLSNDSLTRMRLIVGFMVALALTISISIYQRLEFLNVFSRLDFFHTSLNPSYNQNDALMQHGQTGLLTRVYWPFVEPSYASVWFSGMFTSGIGLFIFTKRYRVGFLVGGMGLLGLLNSMGSTGIAGSVTGVIVLLITGITVMVRNKSARQTVGFRLLLMLMPVIAIGIAYTLLSENNIAVRSVVESIQNRIHYHLDGGDITRPRSNYHAISIALDTWGLGVGLGSNRASSYLLSMISNIGVPGLLLFIFILVRQSILLAHNACIKTKSIEIFILGGSLGVFLGMTLGIPDINFPAWWIWVIGGFGVVASQPRNNGRAHQIDSS